MDITIKNDKSNCEIFLRRHTEDAKGNIFTVAKKFSVRWNGKSVTIPAGFESDGASVPRLLWGVVFPAEDLLAIRAAIMHDYIYRTCPEGWTRAEADAAFRDIMIRDGVTKARAYTAYAGVRLCGGSSWRNK